MGCCNQHCPPLYEEGRPPCTKSLHENPGRDEPAQRFTMRRRESTGCVLFLFRVAVSRTLERGMDEEGRVYL